MSQFVLGSSLTTQQSDKKHKVLLADWTTQLSKQLSDSLACSYSVESITTVDALIAHAKQFPQPDVILIDLVVMSVDKAEICTQLKEDEATRDIPIIFLSSNTSDQEKASGFALGCADYISMPSQITEMKARIETQIKLRQQSQLIASMAFIDPLTHLPNRRRYNEVLTREWARCARYEQAIAMLIIDVDHFKQYNEFYGYATGDSCLVSISRLLKGIGNRPGDLLARIGGEEFALLLSDCTRDGAIQKASKIIDIMAQANISNHRAPHTSRVTLSIGIALSNPALGDDPLSLFQAADEALYNAKRTGRNKWHLSELMDGSINDNTKEH